MEEGRAPRDRTPAGRLPGAGPARALPSLLPLAFLSMVLALGAMEVFGGDGAAADRSRGDAATPAFGEAFAAEGRVVLEEPDSALVSEVRRIAVRSDGVVAVPDPRQDRVRFYGPSGRLLADAGGSGSGPGELDNPGDAAFDDRGRLYVAEGGHPRITRFARDFSFDTVFRVEDAHRPAAVATAGGRLFVYANRPGVGTESVSIHGPDGGVREVFHPRREAYRTVPYWSAAARRMLAVSESHVVAGGNMLYPLVRYGPGGALRDSLGSPPPSWEQPPRPEPGAFTGPNRMRKFAEWRRTFTTIDNVAVYRDSLLVVAHEELDPEIVAYEDASYRADVYELATGRKLMTDVPLPGRLLEGGRHVHLLVSSPPGPWAVGRYRVRDGGIDP